MAGESCLAERGERLWNTFLELHNLKVVRDRDSLVGEVLACHRYELDLEFRFHVLRMCRLRFITTRFNCEIKHRENLLVGVGVRCSVVHCGLHSLEETHAQRWDVYRVILLLFYLYPTFFGNAIVGVIVVNIRQANELMKLIDH